MQDNSFAFSSENNFISSFITKARLRMSPFDSQRTDLCKRKTTLSKSCLCRILETGKC